MLGGYGGQYSFGHAAFFGTGAYVDGDPAGALGINAWVGFAIGIAAGALVGAVIGALTFRSGLRGSYFALVTLAFAEVLAHHRQRRADHRRRRRHAGQARSALGSISVPEPRACSIWIILALVAVVARHRAAR